MKDGDTIVSTVRTYLKAIAFIPLASDNLICSTGFAVITPNEDLFCPKFLFYVCRSENFVDAICASSKGVSYPAIDSSDLKNFVIWIPSLTEQTAIAKYLDEKTAQLDKLIEGKRGLIALLKEERSGVINNAVTRGINPHATLQPSGIDWLGEIPEHWEVKKLKYVANKVQTGSTPPSSREEYFESEVDWFTPSDFSDNMRLSNSKRKISQLAIKDEVTKLFPSNSVLLVGIGATLGKVGYIEDPASSNQQINAITMDSLEKAKFYSYFLYVNQPNIVALANAATLAILNQAQTKDIPVIVSPAEEQKQIVQFIETATGKIDATVATIEKEIEYLREYRTALISEVVTGKIRVA